MLKWLDVLDIAIELDDKFPDTDPLTINFVDLADKVMGLENFDDDKDKVGEKILEAIQMTWIDERD